MVTLRTILKPEFYWGGNPTVDVSVNSKGGKLLGLLSQLRPRIRPLMWVGRKREDPDEVFP
jgi:hypothetical protein